FTVFCTCVYFFFSSRRRHTRSKRDWSSDVCSSDLFFFRVFPQKFKHQDHHIRRNVHLQISCLGTHQSQLNPCIFQNSLQFLGRTLPQTGQFFHAPSLIVVCQADQPPGCSYFLVAGFQNPDDLLPLRCRLR